MRDGNPQFKIGSNIGPYRLLQKPGVDNTNTITPLGDGGTSLVFLVEQKLANEKVILRALKLFSPTEDLKQKIKSISASYGQHNFIQEIDAISSLTHQNIVKIIDAGYTDDKRPYFVVRDSHHTGIPAGAGIDIGNIIENLIWSKQSNALGVTRTGVFSVEHLLCARYWMFARLYWNTPNRSITAMLRHVVYEILNGGHLSRTYLSRELMNVDESGALQVLQRAWQRTGGYARENSTIVGLLRQSRPRTYKLLLELFCKNWSNDADAAHSAMKRCQMLQAEDLERLRLDFLKDSKNRDRLDDDSTILFDVTHEFPIKLGEDIFVEITQGEEKPLSQVSDIVQLLPETFFETAVRLRVFYHPALERDLVNDLRNEVREFLDERFLRSST